jgi:hypothetical protein
MNGPYLFLLSFPIEDTIPIEAIEILHDTRVIYNYIILAIIDQDLYSTEGEYYISYVTSSYVIGKCSIYCWITWQEFNKNI